MGSENGDADEKPVHVVKVGGFCLDRTEVTVEAYAACVKEWRCSAEYLKEYSDDGTHFTPGKLCNYGVDGRDRHPINCVSQVEAEAYCKGLGRRLPTEEEWEYAARGGSAQRTYPWGEDGPANRACWDGEGNRWSTCEVGKYPGGDSVQGVHDLAGNVWEWTSSAYCVPYPEEGVRTCAEGRRVLRGGSWSFVVASTLRAAYRNGAAPASRFNGVGFRCARTTP
jgi:formylglycine-generating enzyme required for sulfatase activity